MHAEKREAAWDRYNYGKSIVAGVKDRRTNKVSAGVVDNTTFLTLQTFIEDRVVSVARLYTDDASAYRNLPFFEHESVNHSDGEYVRGDAGTQGIESFWSMLKRAHMGRFHKISVKHMDRYVTEFAGRHNAREYDTLAQMKNIVRGMVGRRLRYADLIRIERSHREGFRMSSARIIPFPASASGNLPRSSRTDHSLLPLKGECSRRSPQETSESSAAPLPPPELSRRSLRVHLSLAEAHGLDPRYSLEAQGMFSIHFG